MNESIIINQQIQIDASEIELSAMRAQGAGGQNVNKVNSAIHLRFDVAASSLPARYKTMLLACKDKRLTQDGVFVLKAQQHRTQELNRADAIARLIEWVNDNTKVQKYRVATKPTRASKRKRMDKKSKHGQQKALRRKVDI